MAEFTVNAHRFDPYKNFKFLVLWDGRTVAGISKISPLKRTTEVVKHRHGGDPSSPRKSPGRSEFDGITLERGVTHDPEFDRWANKVWQVARASAPRSPSPTSARTSSSRSSTRPARSPSRTSCTGPGPASTRSSANSTPTPTPWPSSR